MLLLALPDPVPVAAGGCALLVLLLVAWLAVRRRNGRTLLRTALADSDPCVRRAALTLVGQRGLAPHAAALLRLAQREQDPSVLDALAAVVAGNQWEPARDERLVELRLWAQKYTDGRARDWPDPEGETAPRFPRGAGRAGAMDVTVVVSGAGGPAGISVIRALRRQDVRVVAADSDELAAGLRLADDAVVLPRHDDPAFVERLCGVALQTNADALVCTVAEEMLPLADAREELETVHLSSWIPDRAALEACMDKWKFAEVLERAGITAPATSLASAEALPGPWIVKPRFGRGSRGVHAVAEVEELDWALTRVAEPIVQTKLQGLEFTVDALVDHDGTLAGAVPRWRLETKAGISTKGRTFRDNELLAGVERVLQAIGLRGAANVQGFLLAEGGGVSFVEVNPRFSGGLPLSLAAGADLVGEYLRGTIGLPIRRDALRYESGVVMTRYYGEIFER